jgi:hypothetical protein
MQLLHLSEVGKMGSETTNIRVHLLFLLQTFFIDGDESESFNKVHYVVCIM